MQCKVADEHRRAQLFFELGFGGLMQDSAQLLIVNLGLKQLMGWTWVLKPGCLVFCQFALSQKFWILFSSLNWNCTDPAAVFFCCSEKLCK